MLQTDQKPLQGILSKSLVEATPWMQRLLLPTIPYDMTVEYIKGETNFIADCLSRAPVAKDTIKLPILQVNQITAHTRCTQDRIDRLQQFTVKDDTLALLKHTVQHGWPQTTTELPPELRPYWTFREEISIADGILLKGERIIISGPARHPAATAPWPPGSPKVPVMHKSLCIGPTSLNS